MDGSSGGVSFATWLLSFLLVSFFVFLEVTITGISKREKPPLLLPYIRRVQPGYAKTRKNNGGDETNKTWIRESSERD